MKSFAGKVAVITGAASGMGKEMALQLGREGALLALSDVNGDGLRQTAQQVEAAGGTAFLRTFDVSNAEQVERFSRDVIAHYTVVDLLINNAGVALSYIPIENLAYADLHWILGINLMGVIYCTKAFLPHLKQRGDANIVNISSLFGIAAVGTNAAYSTSKFAVRGFTEALRQEVAKDGIYVTVVHPGNIRTDIAINSRNAYWPEQESTPEQRQNYVERFEKLARTSAEEAARQIIEAARRNKPRLLIGSDAHMLDSAVRLHPATYDRIVRKYVLSKILLKKAPEKSRKM